MTKRMLALLLLILLLTACTPAPEAGTEQTYTLPALKPEDTAQTVPSDLPPEPSGEALPELDARNYGSPRILGPAGSVYAICFQRNMPRDPVYGDLDGDGRQELIYRTPGSVNGGTYEVLTAYGLEDGWPVQVGEAFFALNGGKTELTAEDGRVFYRYQGQREDVGTALLPVDVYGGRLWVNSGGELPEGLEFLTNRASLYGVSWRQIRQEADGRTLAAAEQYLLWKEPGVFYTGTELEEEEGLQSLRIAAVSNDGATVTGLIYWYRDQEGELVCSPSGIPSLPEVKQPKELIGLTEKELTNKLGEPCFEPLRSGAYAVCCWFTAENKLLTVEVEGTVLGASLTDLPVDSD